MDAVREFNNMWHSIGRRMKKELAGGKYPALKGLSAAELDILQIIGNRPGCMMKDVCDHLGLAKSTLTSAASRLEQKGYISKGQDIEDGRAYNLTLTKLGAQAHKEHHKKEYTVFAELMRPLSAKERVAFIKLFSKALHKKKLIRWSKKGWFAPPAAAKTGSKQAKKRYLKIPPGFNFSVRQNSHK